MIHNVVVVLIFFFWLNTFNSSNVAVVLICVCLV